jgi:hypothetical protein
LRHSWSSEPDEPEHACVWIGLNPSKADENQLDPTLRRVRGFSMAWGFNTFYMLNLFAFRATKPKDMRKAPDPVGRRNDYWLRKMAQSAEMVICAWGNHGLFRDRQQEVLEMLEDTNLYYLDVTTDGAPKHPLYLKRELLPIPLDKGAEAWRAV